MKENTYKTDPLKKDTDGDTLSDGDDVASFTSGIQQGEFAPDSWEDKTFILWGYLFIMNSKLNNSANQTKELSKPMSVLIYCVLIFVIGFTSCSIWFVSNNPDYMYALKAKKIFYRNEDSFKKVVDYIIALDLPTIDSNNSVSLTLYPNGSSNIDSDIDQETIEALKATECKEVVYYHEERASLENSNEEHLIQFKYFYSKGEYPIIEYSSNDLYRPGTVFDAGIFYDTACIDLDDNWRLYYRSNKECKTG